MHAPRCREGEEVNKLLEGQRRPPDSLQPVNCLEMVTVVVRYVEAWHRQGLCR